MCCVNGSVKGGILGWVVAADIAERIEDLRVALGLTQRGLAKRAGVRAPQLSNWIRKVQRPPKSRLESWATREGWSIEIFAEGGPMPSTVVNRPLTARSRQKRGNGQGGRSAYIEALELFEAELAVYRARRELIPREKTLALIAMLAAAISEVGEGPGDESGDGGEAMG